MKRLLWLLHKWAVSIAILSALIASGRILSTYTVFNHTADEPGHLACGMQYLAANLCPLEYAPLPHAMIALGPYVAGARSHGISGAYQSEPQEGLTILYDHYGLYLTLARLGVLPFFWICCLVVYLWSARDFGRPTAAIAVVLFSLLPPILAHAGVATADMAGAAGLGTAFLASLIWAENADPRKSLICGAFVGLAAVCKFSNCGFLPVCLFLALACYLIIERENVILRARQHARFFFLAAFGGAIAVWAGYQFSFGSVPGLPFRIPAPEFVTAIRYIAAANQSGQPEFLLGEVSETGWWYYYPVVLAVKTPIAFLVLSMLGVVACWQQRRNPKFFFPLCFAAGVLLVGLFSQINIGVRHVLPIYLGLSIVAANGAVQLLQRPHPVAGSAVIGLLVCWMMLSGALKHPDYLAYFNEFVRSRPERVLVDSDLDWGQDLKRLSRRLHELGAREVRFHAFMAADLEGHHGFPPVKPIDPVNRIPGWTAVSPTWWELNRFKISLDASGADLWPDQTEPTERVGAILLFHFPEAAR